MKDLIIKHYLDHPFLNRSVYPKGWTDKMDRRIEQEQPIIHKKYNDEKKPS